MEIICLTVTLLSLPTDTLRLRQGNLVDQQEEKPTPEEQYMRLTTNLHNNELLEPTAEG